MKGHMQPLSKSTPIFWWYQTSPALCMKTQLPFSAFNLKEANFAYMLVSSWSHHSLKLLWIIKSLLWLYSPKKCKQLFRCSKIIFFHTSPWCPNYPRMSELLIFRLSEQGILLQLCFSTVSPLYPLQDTYNYSCCSCWVRENKEPSWNFSILPLSF